MQRRDFFRMSFVASSALLTSSSLYATTQKPRDMQEVSTVSFPEKRPLITYSDRPPLLESPRETFTTAITPNNELFVRWHMPKIPTHINMETYYLHIHGEVHERLYLTLDRLKKEFEAVEVTVAMQCGGNSRSAFSPTTTGIQWGSGAMGCSVYKGVRLKDVLKRAGLKEEAKWITLNGDDKPVMEKIASFKRELEIEKISDDTIIAYEQNGEDLPFLNGYPLRLIIPGFYADSWVKMLSNIHVTKEYVPHFYMDTAYRIPDNECECELPEKRALKSKPLEEMNVKSYIGYPTSKSQIPYGSDLTIKGVAFDEGSGIEAVYISLDGGKNWSEAFLDKELSPYAFRLFRYKFRVKKKNSLTIMAKARNKRGEEQPFPYEVAWNHGGYKYNGIDSVTVTIV